MKEGILDLHWERRWGKNEVKMWAFILTDSS